MKVRELSESEKKDKPNMEFCIIINGDKKYFTRDALFELVGRIETALGLD